MIESQKNHKNTTRIDKNPLCTKELKSYKKNRNDFHI